MQAFSFVFKWFVDLLDWVTRLILGLVGLQMTGEHMTVYTIEELKQILSDSEESGIIKMPEREMLHAIFDLGELLVRQVMVPRTEVIAVEADMPLNEVIAITTNSKYAKLPVYEDNLDQVIGIVHVRDLLQAMLSSNPQEIKARDLSREAIFVPETIPVSTLLQEFREKRRHIATVLDEYGGTAGIVTLEDLLEEIVGEVSDPFDALTSEIQTLPDGSALIDGLALIEEVNERLDLNLVNPDYDTIAGYVLGKLNRIARAGDIVEGDGIRLKVESMDGLRINQLLLTRMEEHSNDTNLST
jgi:putative hemolysin